MSRHGLECLDMSLFLRSLPARRLGGGRRSSRSAWIAAAVLAVAAAAPTGAAADPSERLIVQFKQRPGQPERELVRGHGGHVRHAFPSVRALAVEGPAARMRALGDDRSVSRVEVDGRVHASSRFDEELVPAIDNGLYGLVTTRSVDAHARGVTGTGVTACVADTGIDAGHPDLSASYAGGVDTVDDDLDPNTGPTGVEHGTHVAGTVLADVNGLGVRGVAPDARLFHARVLPEGAGSSSDVMAGVQHLVEVRDCQVVNLSVSGGSGGDIERDFYADMSTKALLVAAAGNDNSHVLFPAAYPGLIAVAAVDRDNVRAGFSNHGPEIDLSGPGVDVLSSVPRDSPGEASVQASQMHDANLLEFASVTPPSGITASLVYAGHGATPSDFPAETQGNIALIQRGSVNFPTKVQNAMDAGAIAAIIYNNAAGDFEGTLGTRTAANGVPWIPAVAVSDSAGAALQADASARTQATVIAPAVPWATLSGTSMASPHVAGVAVLVLAAHPRFTFAQVRQRLEQTALDLGAAGRDESYGFGLVDALAATANASPAAVQDAYTHAGSDTALTVSAAAGLLSNDSDADGDPLTLVKLSNPANGALTSLDLTDGSFTYQPNEGFIGADTFTYKAYDGTAESNAATVTVTVGAGCSGRPATIRGTSAAERLTGTPGADVIAAEAGNDTILSQGANDLVCGGAGRDTINANSGDDRVDGGSGDDGVRGDLGNDRLIGGLGNDTVGGDAGNDHLSGGAGNDNCRGDAGTDTADTCERTSGVP